MIQSVSWFVFVSSSAERVAADHDEMETQGQLEYDILMFPLSLESRYRAVSVSRLINLSVSIPYRKMSNKKQGRMTLPFQLT
jgi:hypothetical protein